MPDAHDGAFERFVAKLKRRSEPVTPHVVSRIVRAARGEERARPRPLGWLRRRRTLTFGTLGGLGVAAAIAGLVIGGAMDSAMRDNPAADVTLTPVAMEPLQLPLGWNEVAGEENGGEQPMQVQFLLAAPGAENVSLVGDFNGWDPAAAPMTRNAAGIWSASVVLMPGRHVYAFVVNDSMWTPDPRQPVDHDPDFGRPNSVIVVGGI